MTKSKIKINPVTMEIEFEVSDAFLEKYFQKLTDRLPKAKQATPRIKAIKTKAAPAAKAKKTAKRGRPKRVAPKPAGKHRRPTGEKVILEAIKNSQEEGITLCEVADATKLERSFVRAKINQLKAKGILSTVGRGRYIGIEYAEADALVPTPDMED